MCTALVVDDDGFFRKAISRLLREQFPTLEVKEARDGQEALQELDGVDLLFVDISLPAESGLDLTAKIKSAHPDLLVSILSRFTRISAGGFSTRGRLLRV